MRFRATGEEEGGGGKEGGGVGGSGGEVGRRGGMSGGGRSAQDVLLAAGSPEDLLEAVLADRVRECV
jgi:hypothetical protein